VRPTTPAGGVHSFTGDTVIPSEGVPLKPSVVLAAAVLTAAGFAASTAAGQSSPTQIKLVEPEQGATFTIVDSPPTSPTRNPQSPKYRTSIGDRGFFSASLLAAKGGSPIGRAYHEVTIVKGNRFPKATFQTRVTLTLGDGQIVAEGAYGPGASRTLAIVGGTGRYAGARGTYTNTDAGDDTITLTP
jgi:hypothetical protein